jgi:hypothetical protein
MGRVSPYFRRTFGLLIAGVAAWIFCGPATARAWVLVVKNLTKASKCSRPTPSPRPQISHPGHAQAGGAGSIAPAPPP